MRAKFFVFALIALGGTILTTSAEINYAEIQADQNFRDGVVRLHDGLYSEAVTLFQKSLSARPTGPEAILTRIWLGRAYYHAGFEDAAAKEWKTVAAQGGAGPALGNFQEYLTARNGLSTSLKEDTAFFPVKEVSSDAKITEVRRPSSVLPLPNGETLVTSFGTNALVVMDANGRFVRSLRGGLTRMAGPFDMTLVNGERLYVTQTLSNQVFEMRVDGTVVKTWGKKGIGNGEFMGPQYIAADNTGYLYVSDFGNRRIQKFDPDGNFVIAFGGRTESFDGLARPTGLLWFNNKLYVLDARRTGPRLLMFDASGNLLDMLADERLADAESMSPLNADALIITTKKTLFNFQVSSQTLSTIYPAEKPGSRFTKSALDYNGTIVTADFDREKLELFNRLSGVYAGLHVQINRVIPDNFPEVLADVSITDNLGRPVLGLDQSNFNVTEGKRALTGWQLTGAGHRETSIDAMFVIESSLETASPFNIEAVQNAVTNAFDAVGDTAHFGLVSAGANPSLDAPLGSPKDYLKKALSGLPQDRDWSFDRALRMAVPSLIKTQGLRHILFVAGSRLPEKAFAAYGLQEALSYLRNNRIKFSVINLQTGVLDPALDFLVRETGGVYREVYQPNGLAGLGKALRDKKDGSYYFKFQSKFDSDFGRKYLPLEVEVRLFQKSGRDESGYFAPKKF